MSTCPSTISPGGRRAQPGATGGPGRSGTEPRSVGRPAMPAPPSARTRPRNAVTARCRRPRSTPRGRPGPAQRPARSTPPAARPTAPGLVGRFDQADPAGQRGDLDHSPTSLTVSTPAPAGSQPDWSWWRRRTGSTSRNWFLGVPSETGAMLPSGPLDSEAPPPSAQLLDEQPRGPRAVPGQVGALRELPCSPLDNTWTSRRCWPTPS
jgi:hypothetical protein